MTSIARNIALIISMTFSAVTFANVQPGGTCYNCDNFTGTWECKSGSLSGGTECTVNQTSCTVSGNCNSSLSGEAPVSGNCSSPDAQSAYVNVPENLILEIARAYPRIAATLWTVTSSGPVASARVCLLG